MLSSFGLNSRRFALFDYYVTKPIDTTKLILAIAKVKTQHLQKTGRLEAIAVEGILAPHQAIFLDTNL